MFKETKSNYKQVLFNAINETKGFIEKNTQMLIYVNILEQLENIKNLLIIMDETISKDDLFRQYTFGAIAAKNFDETIYGDKLMFLFGMAYKYQNLPEE